MCAIYTGAESTQAVHGALNKPYARANEDEEFVVGAKGGFGFGDFTKSSLILSNTKRV